MTVMANKETHQSTQKDSSSTVMESELKSLQSKIMDLENKLCFTAVPGETNNVDEELLKSGIMLPQNDQFKSIDEGQEYMTGRGGSGKYGNKKASIGGGSTDKANKVMHNNFLKKNSGSDLPEYSRKSQQQMPSNFSKASSRVAVLTNHMGKQSSQQRKPEEKKSSSFAGEKPKFKMEVDLSALNGRVHFADEEKFMIPS